MANLTRVEDFDDLFSDMMKGFFVRPMSLPFRTEAGNDLSIRLDVHENDQAYKVSADIPGVNKDDIKVTVDGGLVTISAVQSRQSEKKRATR